MGKPLSLILAAWLLTQCSPINPGALQPASSNMRVAGQQLELHINRGNFPATPGESRELNARSSIYFTKDSYYLDARELGGMGMTGSYSYQITAPNQAVILENVVNPQNNQPELVTTIQLNYADKSSGNFTSDSELRPGENTHLEGTFNFSRRPWVAHAQDLTNQIYTLHIAEIHNQNTSTQLQPGAEVRVVFKSPIDATFSVNQKSLGPSLYHNKNTGPFASRMQGQLDAQPCTIDFTFLDLHAGTFKLNLGSGKTLASGSFETFKITPIPPVSLKGQMLDDLHIVSKHTGIDYPYSVYLPPQYASSQKRYPVIYVTDGQWNKGLANYLELQNKEYIMVAIAQGPENRREVDYLMPGAKAYMAFLKQELVPEIDTRFRTARHRSFYGQSLGGALGALLLTQETGQQPFFNEYLLSDPTISALPPGIVAEEDNQRRQNPRLPLKLLLASTAQGNGLMVDTYEKRFTARHFQDLHIRHAKYNTMTHEEMGPPSFADFLQYLN